MSDTNPLDHYRTRMRGMVDLAASDLGIEKTWSDTLFLGDVLDKYIVDPTVRRLDGLESIVRELAERGPFSEDEGWCAHCNTYIPGTPEMCDPANHNPRSLWRRAKALYPVSGQ